MIWEKLPESLKIKEVKPYYDILKRRWTARLFKRLFDITASSVLIILLLPIMFIIGLAVKCDSFGPAIYKSRRITRYGRPFTIYKFRTMKWGNKGSTLTASEDERITRIGKFLRPYRLDELPQLFNVIKGEMSFVGPRPESEEFVRMYSGEMLATLLLPAGITSKASIAFKNEDKILKKYGKKGIPPEEAYIKYILPKKAALNLEYIKSFGFFSDILICIKTLF